MKIFTKEIFKKECWKKLSDDEELNAVQATGLSLSFLWMLLGFGVVGFILPYFDININISLYVIFFTVILLIMGRISHKYVKKQFIKEIKRRKENKN